MYIRKKIYFPICSTQTALGLKPSRALAVCYEAHLIIAFRMCVCVMMKGVAVCLFPLLGKI
jgi:hypothetical protein